MAEWSDNIAKILRETKIPKITGNLIGHNKGGDIGKCALGIISCEVGLPLTLELAMADNLPSYIEILRKAGVPEEYIEQIWEEYHADFCDKDCMCKEEN